MICSRECVTLGFLRYDSPEPASSKPQSQEQLEILKKCCQVKHVHFPELHFQMWVQFRLMTVLLLSQLLSYYPVLFVGMTIPVRVAQYVHDPVKPVQGGLFFNCLCAIPVNRNPAK